MKAESILFLLSIHEGNELRDQLPGSAYDELASAGLLDGTDITDRGYAFVRQLEAVELPVQMWVDPHAISGGSMVERKGKVTQLIAGASKPAPRDPIPPELREELTQAAAARGGDTTVMVTRVGNNVETIDVVPAGYQPNHGRIPIGVDRASDIQIVRANGKRKTLPAQTINWADKTTPDRVVGWRYAAAGAEARIHTPGETMPAPDPSVQ